MEKLKYTIIAVALFASAICIAQQAKPMVPVTGSIVFTSEELIVDEDVFQKSADGFVHLVQQSVVSEREEYGLETDSLQLAVATAAAKAGLLSSAGSSPRQHYVFRDSLIVEFTTSAGKVIGDYTIINKRSGQTEMLAKKDSATVYLKRPYAYSDSEIIAIKEFRDETRLIGGLPCFKVVYSCREQADFPEGLITYKELWVTDRIQCLYHPVIREKQVLQKYYPLEVTEYSEMLKGMITKSSLVSLNLN